MQETPVRSLIQEDHTCCRATEPVCPNSWACSVESRNHNHWAQKPQLLKPAHPRAHALQQEKPCQWEAHAPPLESRVCSLQTEKSPHDHRDPAEPKTSNFLIHERKKSNFRKNACHMYKLQEFLHMHYNNDTRMFMAAKNCQQTQLPVGESDKSQDMQGEVTERMQGVLIHWHRKTSVLGFFRDKTNTHTYVHLSQQTEDPGEPIFQSKSKDWCPSSQSDKRSLLFCHLFVLLRPSNGWTRPTHTGQSHSLCRVHQFKVNFIQKHPQRHSQNHAGPSVWAPQGLFWFTHEISLHNTCIQCRNLTFRM